MAKLHYPKLMRPYGTVYYGWIVVGALAITEPVSWGVLFYGFGVMLTPMQRELGWSQAALTGAFSLMLLLSGITAVPVGRWLDRHGARGLMTLGSILATLATIAWAQVQTLVGFYLLWAAIGVICAMILYEPAFAVVATWFVRRRHQALTVLTFGGGLASVIFVPLATWLVQLYGWRGALWILAAILAVITIPLHALLLRRSPAALGLLPDGDLPSPPAAIPYAIRYAPNANVSQQHLSQPSISVRQALHHAPFWWLSLAFALSTFVAVALSVHLIPFLSERGYPTPFVALIVSVLGGSQIPGRLLFAPLGNWLPLRTITAVLFGCMTVGLLILLLAPSAAITLLGAVLFGMGSGASSPARAGLVAEFYGVANYGSINGVMTLVQTFARASAPLSMGLLYTWAGAYPIVFGTLVVIAANAVVAILCARSPHS